jgi:hypothetical protein
LSNLCLFSNSGCIYHCIQKQWHTAVTPFHVCTYPGLMHELHLLHFMMMGEKNCFLNVQFKAHYSLNPGQGLALQCNISTAKLLQWSQDTFRKKRAVKTVCLVAPLTVLQIMWKFQISNLLKHIKQYLTCMCTDG